MWRSLRRASSRRPTRRRAAWTSTRSLLRRYTTRGAHARQRTRLGVRPSSNAVLLERIPACEDVVAHVLETYIRPIFRKAAERARVQASGRAAPGARHPVWDDDVETWDDAQIVGGHPARGAPNVLAWCVATLGRTDAGAWERLWPHLVPPIMVLLDAPGARAKLLGACVAGNLLDPQAPASVPASLLHRTGLAALLGDALTSALHHMTDAEYGAPLLSAAIRARRGLATILYPDVDATADAFDAHARLFSEGVLAALSYCAPPSASAPAQRASPGTALGSARLQQALAGTAARWALVLCTDLGTPVLRFWNAYMDWATGWLSQAFAGCESLACPPRRGLSEVVTEITEGEQGEQEVIDAPDWATAGAVLVASVEACVRSACTLTHLAAQADREQQTVATLRLPAQLPGLAAWSEQLVCASARCYVHLSELSLDANAAASVASLKDALHALCTALLAADPILTTVRRLADAGARRTPQRAAPAAALYHVTPDTLSGTLLW